MNNPKLYIMCGISGSGKSTWAAIEAEYNSYTTVVSTDAIRGELWGDENDQREPQKVFDTAFKRIEKLLHENTNVIFDATNLGIQERGKIIRRFKPLAFMICVDVHCDVRTAIERQSQRERKVPSEVIMRQARKYKLPTYAEGWDDIRVL